MTIDKTFKALRVVEQEPKNFTMSIADMAQSDLADHELLIKIHYSSLNFKDALSAHGNRGVTKTFPHTPGIDAAGVVVEDKSNRFKEGDQVIVTGYDLGMNTPGGLAEYIRVPADWAVALPSGLTLRESMTYGTAGLTAALCVDKIIRMGAQPSDGDVVVTGATGGVGTMSISMLAKLGYTVAAVTGKVEANQMLTDLGASKLIDRAMLAEVSKAPMAKPQWAHGIDALGGDYLVNVLKSLHYGGSVAACGLAADVSLNATVLPFILRGVNLLGVDSVELPQTVKADMWTKLASAYKPTQLDSMATEISLEQAPHFLQQIFNGKAMGRYLVKVA